MQDHANSGEKRTLKRWHLIFYLRVFNHDNGTLLGHVVDISEAGMMLVSDKPIAEDQEFRLWIDIPQETGSRQRISLNAHSLWSQNDSHSDFYNSGFRIINPKSEAIHRLRAVIETFNLEFKGTD